MGDSGKLDELLESWEEQAQQGQEPSLADLCRDTPELLPELQRRVEALKKLGWMGSYVAPPPTDRPIIEGYRLLSKLGQGGFGQVWKAQGPNGEVVALKVVEVGENTPSEWRVIEQLKKLRHPNILTIFNAWKTDTALVIAMELAEGSLMDRFCQCRAKGLPGIPGEELHLSMRQAAAGIDALHASNVTHRDIKPSNLLLVGGVVKVADFGLAKTLTRSRTVHTGAVTLDYAAPEFLEGETTKAGDQYSLAMTYCHLRGRLPFEGAPAQVMAAHLRRSPTLTMLPVSERPIVSRALEKKPENRWPSCTDFVDHLVQTHQTVVDGRTTVLPESGGRWWWRWGTACAFSLVAAGGLLGWALRGVVDKQQTPRRVAEGMPSQPTSEKQLPVQVAPVAAKPHLVKANDVDLDSLPSFEFDGRSRIVTPLVRFAPVTLECWAWPTESRGGRVEKYLIGSDIAGFSGIGMGFVFHAKEKAPYLGVQLLPCPAERGIGTTTPIPLRRWSHVAAVFGETATVLYLNGQEVVRGAPTANKPGTVFVVGNAGRENRDLYISGRMRTVRISRGARYSGNFQPETEFAPDSSAVLIYSASKVEGGRATDLSGHGNEGALDGVKVIQPPK